MPKSNSEINKKIIYYRNSGHTIPKSDFMLIVSMVDISASSIEFLNQVEYKT